MMLVEINAVRFLQLSRSLHFHATILSTFFQSAKLLLDLLRKNHLFF